jgi:hypothetical protein
MKLYWKKKTHAKIFYDFAFYEKFSNLLNISVSVIF